MTARAAGAARDEAAVAPAVASELRVVFAALMMVLILASLDQSIVNTALPRMTSDLGGMTHISWVVMAFLLAATVSTPIYGKLGDMYGRRRLLIASISIFLFASALCGTAQTMLQLILFRGLQGLGAGGLVTLTQTAIGDLVGPRGRGRYQGLFTGAMAVSSVAGPLIGGILTTALSWRWVFYVNLPVGAVALTLIVIGLHHKPPVTTHRVDFLGAVLLTGATVSALLVLNWGGSVVPWRSASAIGLIALSICLAVLFFLQERRAAEPLMNLSMFRIRSFVIGVSTSGCMTFAMTGAMVFMPLYFQLVLGLDPARAGLMTLPQVVVMIVTSVVGGQLSSRSGLVKPFMMLGVGFEAAALIGCAVLAWSGAGIPAFLVAMAVLGFGMGMGMPNATVVIQNAVPRAYLGVATATMGFVRSLGGVLGVAISGSAMAARLGHDAAEHDTRLGIAHIQAMATPLREVTIAAYRHAIAVSFTISGGVMLLAFLLVLTLRGVRIEERPTLG
jgi:EmrB/QacA subfamily drug resistance transporter